MKYILLIAVAMVMLACGNDSSDSTTTDTITAPPPVATPTSYPSIPAEVIKYLADNCDYVDYVFYELPLSMSLQDEAAIHYSLSHISTQEATIDPNCKAMGRIFYQVKGENVSEADIFFQEGCTYLVFYLNGKKAYSNLLTEEGVKYLSGNIAKGIQMQQQGGQ